MKDVATHTVYLSLGSNLGRRIGAVRKALSTIDAYPDTQVIKVSGFYITEPIDMGANARLFVNCCAKIETTLDLKDFFFRCKDIEELIGGDRHPPEDNALYGDRYLDIDILFYDDLVYRSGGLTIPHSRLLKRRFVIEPLSDILSGCLPVTGDACDNLLAQMPAAPRVRRMRHIG